jgi:hypothetical protein
MSDGDNDLADVLFMDEPPSMVLGVDGTIAMASSLIVGE